MNVVFLLTTAVLMAAEPDARVLRLLTEDTQMIGGIDWERYAGSRLMGRFPVSLTGILGGNAAWARVAQMVTIGDPDSPSLFVLFGEFGPVPPPVEGEAQRVVFAERGVLFVGEPEATAAAVAAWRRDAAEVPRWASRIRELGRDYDNWVFIRNPLPEAGKGIAPAPRPRWDELRKSVADASMGVRLGARIECYGSVSMASFEDAAAAAALGRWLPALAESRGMGEPDLVALIEGFTARQDGTRVEIRFSLEEGKIPMMGIRAE